MAVTIRRIAVRFALLLALAAVAPLVAYGVVSILSLQRGTRQEVVQGTKTFPPRAAEETGPTARPTAGRRKPPARNLKAPSLPPAQRAGVPRTAGLQPG